MDDGQTTPISSHAVDAAVSRRPGHPQKRDAAPVGAAHWTEPARQTIQPGMTKDPQRPWTATFGTGQRPKGLSGAMRRVAYQIPDYEIRRWALLLLADRVDTMEWQLGRAARSPGAWLTLIASLGGMAALGFVITENARAAKRRRRSRWDRLRASLARHA